MALYTAIKASFQNYFMIQVFEHTTELTQNFTLAWIFLQNHDLCSFCHKHKQLKNRKSTAAQISFGNPGFSLKPFASFCHLLKLIHKQTMPHLKAQKLRAFKVRNVKKRYMTC